MKCVLILIQFFSVPFILYLAFAVSNPRVCAEWHIFCSVSYTSALLITKLPSVLGKKREKKKKKNTKNKTKKKTGVLDIQGLSPYFGQFVFRYLNAVQLPLPLSPADCRFYHIWSFIAPCLTAFQDHFLPALPLAVSCSVDTHVNSGIG